MQKESTLHHTSWARYSRLTSGIRRLMDGMELNSMALRHALTAALVDDCDRNGGVHRQHRVR